MRSDPVSQTLEAQPPAASTGKARDLSAAVGPLLHRWGLALVLVATVAFFSVQLPGVFLTWSNLHDMIAAQAPILLLALAAGVVLVVGEFDLSLGATLSLTQYVALLLMTSSGTPVGLATAIALGIGVVIGAVNVLLVVGASVNSFIATIAVQTVLLGLATLVSNGNQPIFAGAPAAFTAIGNTEILSVPLSVWIALAIALALWLLLDRTTFGRTMRASGANRAAARLSGLRVTRALVVALVLASALAAVAGLLEASRTGTSDSVSGSFLIMPAYAAAFLGATGSKHGQFSVPGTLIAILLVAVGVTGLQLMGAASWVTNVFNGTVLIVAVLLSQLARRSTARRS